MRIYIQSKSGDFNHVLEMTPTGLIYALGTLKRDGGYQTEHRGDKIMVPFEEIQYIRVAKEDE